MLHAISTSDWHLEGLFNHFGDEGVDMQLSMLESILLYAVERGIKHVFVPGDITDKDKMTDTTKRKLLALLVKYQGIVEIYYIGGNHDRGDKLNTSMDLIASLSKEWGFLTSFHIFMEPEQVVIDGVVVNMLPHPCRESIPHKRPCLNFVHSDIVGAKGDNGLPLRTKRDVNVDPRDYTIGGHIHLYQHLEKRRLILNGSPYQKNFGENNDKGFIEFRAGYVRGGKELKVSHRFVPLPQKWELRTLLISDQQELSSLSTDRYLRYRLFFEEGVVVPADLRVRYQNIAQMSSAGKGVVRTLNTTGALEVKATSTVVHPSTGLRRFLTQQGMAKNDIKECGCLLKKALTELGYEQR